jgi:toluene monooxygenase system protein A
MPKLRRSDWYDIARDMNWTFRYVTHEEAFPPEIVGPMGDTSPETWWKWDEPYKLSYREYVYNQVGKDAGVAAVGAAIARSNLFDALDEGWKGAIKAHFGAVTVSEGQSTLAESRMGRFGLAAAWRNMALYGALDEMRHVQIQLKVAHSLLDKDPQFDWAHKAYHTGNWAIIAAMSHNDELFLGSDVISTAIQLTFTFETGFTNLQFIGMAADAMELGDVEFGALISSIQTDEARHAQQGEPTLRLLLETGQKDLAQRLIDVSFWRAWHLFATLTGPSLDYWTPLEHRAMSFKEFMEEWIIRQFMDQLEDLGLEKPWYWEQFLDELDWYHHSEHAGIWYFRNTVWWNPDAGVSVSEREWLEAKYPGWNKRFGMLWDTIGESVRGDKVDATFGKTLPVLCNTCHLPVFKIPGTTSDCEPRQSVHEERTYTFCSDPCQWIFDQSPQRYAGTKTLIDRLIMGDIQPPTIEGILEYMGITPDIAGDDAAKYRWATDGQPALAAGAAA